jgi:hypothetical protein
MYPKRYEPYRSTPFLSIYQKRDNLVSKIILKVIQQFVNPYVTVELFRPDKPVNQSPSEKSLIFSTNTQKEERKTVPLFSFTLRTTVQYSAGSQPPYPYAQQ